MIEEQALVTAVDEDGYAWVEVQRNSTCGGCAAKNGCGTATLAKVLGARRTRLRVRNDAAARNGDLVIVGLEESSMLRGSALLYLMPLAGLLAGAGVMTVLLPVSSELPVILAALAGLAAGLWLVRRISRGEAFRARFEAIIIKRINPGKGDFDSVFPA